MSEHCELDADGVVELARGETLVAVFGDKVGTHSRHGVFAKEGVEVARVNFSLRCVVAFLVTDTSSMYRFNAADTVSFSEAAQDR